MSACGKVSAAPRRKPLERAETEDHWRCRSIVVLLEEARGKRVLTRNEERLLAWARSRLSLKREVWRWSEREDRKIRALLARRPIRQRYSYAKPFQPNDEVRKLAQELGRTEWAVYRRMERLRKKMECSKAGRRAEGVG